jgi:hypothetical protein
VGVQVLRAWSPSLSPWNPKVRIDPTEEAQRREVMHGLGVYDAA